jgi:hypothetical protein
VKYQRSTNKCLGDLSSLVILVLLDKSKGLRLQKAKVNTHGFKTNGHNKAMGCMKIGNPCFIGNQILGS